MGGASSMPLPNQGDPGAAGTVGREARDEAEDAAGRGGLLRNASLSPDTIPRQGLHFQAFSLGASTELGTRSPK